MERAYGMWKFMGQWIFVSGVIWGGPPRPWFEAAVTGLLWPLGFVPIAGIAIAAPVIVLKLQRDPERFDVTRDIMNIPNREKLGPGLYWWARSMHGVAAAHGSVIGLIKPVDLCIDVCVERPIVEHVFVPVQTALQPSWDAAMKWLVEKVI